ncbi:MFS transporter [Acidobacteria bacterium AB60]|nr:MFS transporter [Acidobacteria bacterium AB60]
MSARDGGGSRGELATLAVLHPVFALTGVLHAVGGALLPSLAAAFHLGDAQSGWLFLAYFLGTSLGALLCVRRYARLMTAGFLLTAASCFLVASATNAWLPARFLLLGVGVGIPMTAVSMFAGKRFAERSAAPLTFLNFSWSAGAFLAPLIAARVLLHQTYRSAYVVLGIAAALAAAACWLGLEEDGDVSRFVRSESQGGPWRWVGLFALLTFLEVGVENTTATWLATYTLRSTHAGTASAAAATSFYWCGFLASRGLLALALLHLDPMTMLRRAMMVATIAAALLVGFSMADLRDAAMFVLGAALAPIFPLLLARYFAGAGDAADSRWILATCGFGGSVLPWLTGCISGSSHSLRLGLITVPAALLLMFSLLPALGRQQALRR